MARRHINSLNNQPIPKKKPAPKYCGFCKGKTEYMDYKNVDFLKIFLNPQAKILPRLYTGNCQKHQKRIATAIERGRHLGLIPRLVDNYK